MVVLLYPALDSAGRGRQAPRLPSLSPRASASAQAGETYSLLFSLLPWPFLLARSLEMGASEGGGYHSGHTGLSSLLGSRVLPATKLLLMSASGGKGPTSCTAARLGRSTCLKDTSHASRRSRFVSVFSKVWRSRGKA